MSNYFRHLRDCFGCFTTGVTVATTVTSEQKPVGVTLNSFSSVSLEPPLVLFSLNNQSSLLPIFRNASHFILNILAEKQIQLSRNFALSSSDKWEGVRFTPGEKTAMPRIEGVIAYIECANETTYIVGDHHIFIGKVLECQKLSDDDPLIYYKGNYRAIGVPL